MASLKVRREQIIELEIKAETLQKNVLFNFIVTHYLYLGEIFRMSRCIGRSFEYQEVFLW